MEYMSGPVLIAVDDDADVMRDVERELCDRYARHYRIVCIRSPREVLARLEELAAEGDQVALVLAGQRLSGMTGSELLDQARHLHPHAKRGLLMAWDSLGDRAVGEAIFDSIARGCPTGSSLPSPAAAGCVLAQCFWRQASATAASALRRSRR